jgi:hypothetical protein
MEIRFTNGAVVNRMYGNGTEGELIAAFQYESDAEAFAQAKLDDDARRKWFECHYLVCNTYDGKIKAFRHPPADGTAAKSAA